MLILSSSTRSKSDPKAYAALFRGKDLKEEEGAYCNLCLFLARFSKTPCTSAAVIGFDVPTDSYTQEANIYIRNSLGNINEAFKYILIR